MEFQLNINKGQAQEMDMIFKTLPKRLKSSAMRGAFTRAAKPLKLAMKQNIKPFDLKRRADQEQVNDSILKKSIAHVVRRGKSDRELYAIVGPEREKGWFAHWVEYGTLAKRSEPLKKKRRDQAQKAADKGLGLDKMPFVRKASQSSAKAVQNALGNGIEELIEKHVNKMIKKGRV